MTKFQRGTVSDPAKTWNNALEIVRHARANGLNPPEWEGKPEREIVAQVIEGAAGEIWLNDIYQVVIRRNEDCGEGWPKMTHLSIKRLDREPISRDWRHLQTIKNELLGPEVEAVELYPAESRLVDVANQFHLWALPEGMQFPFGWRCRLADDESGVGGSKQRPLEKDS